MSNEMFYLDKNGKKQDADIHADILDNKEADSFFRKANVAWVKENLNFTESDIKLLYPTTRSGG